MQTFIFKEEDRFELSSTSKGNQPKWYRDRMYFKADMLGYEGFAEQLVSEFLKYVEMPYSFVDYFECKIITPEDEECTGCWSYDMLGKDESMLSLSRVMSLVDRDYERSLRKNLGIERVRYVVETVGSATGLDIFDYLGCITRIDAITLNEDRHFNNINVISCLDGGYKLAPIFDNGLSLLSDTTRDYPMGANVNSLIKRVSAKPFSTDFVKQAGYFGDFKIKVNIEGLLKSLKACEEVFDSKEKVRARLVLLKRLQDLEGIIWKKA